MINLELQPKEKYNDAIHLGSVFPDHFDIGDVHFKSRVEFLKFNPWINKRKTLNCIRRVHPDIDQVVEEVTRKYRLSLMNYNKRKGIDFWVNFYAPGFRTSPPFLTETYPAH